jgi:uncharacterized membrane protein HdeD (DUF308 family)
METTLFRHWWAIALRGVIAIVFGLVALLWPRLTLEALVVCFGAFALVDGMFAVVVALGDRGTHTRWGVLLAEGLVGIAIGLLTFFWPLITALALLYLIATWAILTGVLEIAVAAWMHRAMGNEWLQLFGGIASLLFGVLMAVLPGVGLLALTWLIGVYALVFGVLLIVLGFRWGWFERKLVAA